MSSMVEVRARKVYLDEEGNIVEILYSTEPRFAPLDFDQVRIMAEVKIL